MTYKLKIQQTAESEISIIIEYLTLRSPKAAKTFYNDLQQCYTTLQDGIVDFGLSRFPKLANLGYHVVLFNNYVMLYLEDDNTRIISHIFHQKQDYANIV